MPQKIPKPNGKWLEGVAPDDPLSAAAAGSVSARLEYVAACLPLAAHAADKDAEFVHQLRVGSRRAAAALAAFDDCLPPRRGRKMRRALKRVRRAAGDARDLDVLLLALEGIDASVSAGERDEVQRYMTGCRAAAQGPIAAVAKKLPPKRLERRISKLLKRIRWRGKGDEPTVRAAGQLQMSEVAEGFREAAAAVSDDSSVDALHNLRIVGKRLRYTIELFASAADEVLRRSVYPHVVELQDRLGAMNDHASAEQFFRTQAKSVSAAGLKGILNRFANHELQAVDRSIDAFHDWWSSDRLQEIYSGALNAFPPPSAA